MDMDHESVGVVGFLRVSKPIQEITFFSVFAR